MSEQWQRQFREEGYALLPQVLPHALIDQHVDGVSAIFERHGAHHNARLVEWEKPREAAFHEDLDRLDREEGASFALSMQPTITERLQELFGEPPVRCSVRTALWEFGDRAPHFDTTFVSTTPTDAVCRAWCALEDIHPDSGVFYVVPGTHRAVRSQILESTLRENPEFLDILKRLAADRALVQPELHRRVWPDLCVRMAAAIRALPRRTFALRKGDVVLFSPNAIHGTMPRINPALSRKVMISEWRARSAVLYFASEHFGTLYDRRDVEGAGQKVRDHVRQTAYGLVGESFR